jgi:hypothetical protein
MLRELELDAGEEGATSWDGRDADGRAVRSGVYFMRLVAGGARSDARIVLLQ